MVVKLTLLRNGAYRAVTKSFISEDDLKDYMSMMFNLYGERTVKIEKL